MEINNFSKSLIIYFVLVHLQFVGCINKENNVSDILNGEGGSIINKIDSDSRTEVQKKIFYANNGHLRFMYPIRTNQPSYDLARIHLDTNFPNQGFTFSVLRNLHRISTSYCCNKENEHCSLGKIYSRKELQEEFSVLLNMIKSISIEDERNENTFGQGGTIIFEILTDGNYSEMYYSASNKNLIIMDEIIAKFRSICAPESIRQNTIYDDLVNDKCTCNL